MTRHAIEFDIIGSNPNEIVPRPACLMEPDGANSTNDLTIQLLSTNKITIVGGVSLIGTKMWVVPVIGILQMYKQGFWRGWSLYIGHPDNELAFTWVDSEQTPMQEVPVANTMIYFVGTSEQTSLVLADASLDDLTALARFVFPFISDEGPPKGVDWGQSQGE